MQATDRELWLLNFYRNSELHGALLMGKLARSFTDTELLVNLTKHCATEAHHAASALAVCAEFARSAGFDWLGGLALGAGEGMVHGAPLHELDGRAIPLRNALALAAEALAQGQPIPPTAQALIGKPFIPAWLYRFMGGFGWRQQAKRWGAQTVLRRTPYQVEVSR